MNPFTVVIWLLAFYGVYHLAIKIFGEKEVDDEMSSVEKKITDEVAAIEKKAADKFSGIPKNSGV
jgi:hypothetical protein